MPVYFLISRFLEANSLTEFGDTTSLRGPNGPPNKHFFKWIKLGCQCFLLSVDIYDTNISTWSWGIAPHGDPPKTNFLSDLIFGASFFDISSRYAGNDYFDIVWGATPFGDPPKTDPLQIKFWLPQTRALVRFSNISPYLTDECFDIFKNTPLGPPKWTPKYLFFVCLKLGRQFYFLILTDKTDKYFDVVLGCHPTGYPPPKVDP